MSLKQHATEIWKETFGDSDEYIEMIMEHYYDEKRCRCELSDNKMVASSVVIPYVFERSDGGLSRVMPTISKQQFAGDYLCGLATIPDFRGRGIMRKIIQEIEQDAREEGRLFTFLIPADDSLRKYYLKMGYRDTCPKICISFILKNRQSADKFEGISVRKSYSEEYNFTRINSFNMDDENLLHLAESLSNYNFLENNYSDYLYIIHSEFQWVDVLKDFLRDGAEVIIGKNKSKENKFHKSFENTDGQLEITSDGVNEAIIIVTPDRKIYPLAGTSKNLFHLILNEIIRRRNDNSEEVEVPKNEINRVDAEVENGETYHLEITDPIQAMEISRHINNLTDMFSEVKFSTEKYGMVKFLKEVGNSSKRIQPEKIVIRFMLD